jgi:hypothetical protein
MRENLLQEGKMANYLKYAIGEIVLVVIGILIALQINNWNQDRIDRKNEIKLLKEIKNDLDITIADLENTILDVQQRIDSTIVILEYVDAQIPFEDKMLSAYDYMNGTKWLYPRTIAFENLKSTGINQITNDSIKIKLAEIFGQKLNRIKDIEGRMLELLWNQNQELKNVSIYTEINHSGYTLLKPEHFESFKENKSLINSIIGFNNRRNLALFIYKNYRESVFELKRLIEEELK